MAAIDISTGLTAALGDITTTASAAAPVALPLLGITVGVPLALKVFRKVAR
jgi:hypothetical protein